MGRGVVASARAERLTRQLLMAQGAFASVLVVVAVLLLHSFDRLLHVDAGYDPAGVVTMTVHRGDTDDASAARFGPLMFEVLDQVRRLPGVIAAGIANMTPLDANTALTAFPVPGSLTASELGAGNAPAPRTALARAYQVTAAGVDSPGSATACWAISERVRSAHRGCAMGGE